MQDTTASRSSSVCELIGNTPLLRLAGLEPRSGVELYAKAEWRNPGGSVKDRAAARMIEDGERSGALRPGMLILDATSGNTGIAYAMIAAARGYRVRLCLPESATIERKRILAAYGAELVLTDPMEGSDGAIREARRLYALEPERYFYPDQYNNDANWRAHYDTTGPEIWNQTSGRVTHFAAGLGTTGTFTGVGRRLREMNPRVRLISLQPDSPLHGIEGLKHLPTSLVPGIYDPSLADESLLVQTEEAYAMVRHVAATEGLLVGVSGGAALAGATRVASSLRAGVVVTVLPDAGERYLSASFWDEPAEGLSCRRQEEDRPPNLLEIVPRALEAIHAHAAEAYPSECCGALLGATGGRATTRVVDTLALPNTTEEGARRRFLVSPADYRAAEARARETGTELVGFYHSHPDHPARPSPYDLDHAWPNLSYVIVSVNTAGPADVRSWRLLDDRSQFREEPIRT